MWTCKRLHNHINRAALSIWNSKCAAWSTLPAAQWTATSIRRIIESPTCEFKSIARHSLTQACTISLCQPSIARSSRFASAHSLRNCLCRCHANSVNQVIEVATSWHPFSACLSGYRQLTISPLFISNSNSHLHRPITVKEYSLMTRPASYLLLNTRSSGGYRTSLAIFPTAAFKSESKSRKVAQACTPHSTGKANTVIRTRQLYLKLVIFISLF